MIKLQINNIQVFERLIDLIAPNEESKLELKKQVIQKWTETYIKGIMDDEIKGFINNLNTDLKNSWRSNAIISKEVQAIVDKKVEEIIKDNHLTTMIEGSIERIIKSKFK